MIRSIPVEPMVRVVGHMAAISVMLAGTFLPVHLLSSPAPSPEDRAFFEARIRPVLVDHCYKCHSDQAQPSKGGFQLDTRDGWLRGGESGQPAIIPGDPEKSRLVRAIRYSDADLQMPPKGKLPEEQIADIVRWINLGAPDPRTRPLGAKANVSSSDSPTVFKEGLDHWAFQPLRRPEVPAVINKSWPRSSLDQFILAKLEEKRLKPVADTGKRTLIRRATYDLTGLPPTAEETEAFVRDSSPDAFAQVVERLLASPRYGERWGRHWMDVVRYADTAGDNADYPIPEARLYRDYIIDSFNSDKPYDRFVREQLAGDILAGLGGNFAEQVIATGFVALSRRYATAPFELWHLTVEDTIETTGRAFLGLTLRCARCHDHKYDPISKQDYYGLYGFFASTQYPYAGSEEFASKNFPRSGFVPLASPEQAEARLKEYRAQIAKLRQNIQQIEQEDPVAKELARLRQEIEKKRLQNPTQAGPDQTDPVQGEIASLEKRGGELNKQLQEKLKGPKSDLAKLEQPGLPQGLPGAYAISEGAPTDVALHVRGEPDQTGPVIKRRFPKFLSDDAPVEIPKRASGRLELAQWLTRTNHPLTARVMVNRIWQHHFGKGIVGTPSNVGVRGAPPSHPELLDSLAIEFIESGWSVKAMHRRIMLSRTYQLACAELEANAAIDPRNTLYWRADRRRLEAEAIRDSLLAVADNLDLARPGNHPFPGIDTWKWTQHSPFKAVYPSKHRSVYLMIQRIQRHPYLGLFDAPDANTSNDVRTDSTVPPQALFLINNPFVREQARALAERLIRMSADPQERIRNGIGLAYARAASAEEVCRATAYLAEYQQALVQAGAPPEQIKIESWTSLAVVLLSANEFVYVE